MTDKSYPSPCRNYLQPLYLSVTLYACAQRDKVKSFILNNNHRYRYDSRFHCSVCEQESCTQDRADTKCSQVRVLMSGHIPPMLCFKYSNKEKYLTFLQCHFSLTQFSVSFVHRPLVVEKSFRGIHRGGLQRCFCVVPINTFPLLMNYRYQNHLQMNIVWCSILCVPLISRKSRIWDEKKILFTFRIRSVISSTYWPVNE